MYVFACSIGSSVHAYIYNYASNFTSLGKFGESLRDHCEEVDCFLGTYCMWNCIHMHTYMYVYVYFNTVANVGSQDAMQQLIIL